MSESVVEATPMAAKPRKILGLEVWLFYSLVTILLWGAWGAVSKIASNSVDTYTNQIFFTIGLAPLLIYVLRSKNIRKGKGLKSGIFWAFFTGILGGVGNLFFFHALEIGGNASIVVPATSLFPLVTVALAVTLLREKVSGLQWVGLGLALVAIYLLSL